MAYLQLSILFAVSLTNADYSCMCNYNEETKVFSQPTKNGFVIGYLYEFDCKPAYRYRSLLATPGWFTIQYERKVGYVAINQSIKLQTCPGSLPPGDLVLSTPIWPIDTKNKYKCLCTYNSQTAVYPVPTSSSGAVGYLHGFDCKPTYSLITTSSRWQAIHFKKKIGYVAFNPGIEIDNCSGNPSAEDLVSQATTTGTHFPTLSSTVSPRSSTLFSTVSPRSSTLFSTVSPRSSTLFSAVSARSPTLFSTVSPRTPTLFSTVFPHSLVSASRSNKASTDSTTKAPRTRPETTSSATVQPTLSSRTARFTSPTKEISKPPDATFNAASKIASTGGRTSQTSKTPDPLRPTMQQSRNTYFTEHLETGFHTGTVAGLVVAGFFIGFLCGIVVLFGVFKLHRKTAGKYEVLFQNGSVNQKAVLQKNES